MKSVLKLFIPLLLILSGCTVKPVHDKLQVIVSVYVLEEFAQRIGGDLIDVVNLVPPGIEPHDFELSAQDRIKLQNADVLLSIGVGFENWLDEVAKKLDHTLVVKTGEGIASDPQDPHVWLDPLLAKAMAMKIRDALIQVDPQNKTTYNANARSLVSELSALDALYRTTLTHRVRDVFISSHNAFSYLAKAYGLRQEAIAGANPELDVSALRVKEVINLINKEHIPVIFTEAFLDPKIAEAIAKETSARVMTLVPIENLSSQERNEGENYFSLMKKNLYALVAALTEESL
ncbi:MAG: ABC transporter substrate-binding protein [Erysipelotrichales bacterium]|nr:MAG: ABC transporter substrate-binding protein [Erysipelotrichales bacterium]